MFRVSVHRPGEQSDARRRSRVVYQQATDFSAPRSSCRHGPDAMPETEGLRKPSSLMAAKLFGRRRCETSMSRVPGCVLHANGKLFSPTQTNAATNVYQKLQKISHATARDRVAFALVHSLAVLGSNREKPAEGQFGGREFVWTRNVSRIDVDVRDRSARPIRYDDLAGGATTRPWQRGGIHPSKAI